MRKGIMAYGSGHYVYREKTDLVFDAIVKEYIGTVIPAVKAEEAILK